MHLETFLFDRPRVNTSPQLHKRWSPECHPTSEMWKLRLRAERWVVRSSQLSCTVKGSVSRLPGLLHKLQGAYVQTPGLPSPNEPISRGLQAGSTSDDKSQEDPPCPPPSVSPAGLGLGGWGEGGSQRKLPAAPSRATRSGRDTATSASGERAAVLLQRPWWGECLGTRPGRGGLDWAGGAGRREESRAGSGRPEAHSSGICYHFSINEPPSPAVLEVRSRPRIHSQFLDQHHLPGTPSQLPPLPPPPLPPPPLPPPPLPPLTAPAWPRLPDHGATAAPALPHPSAETRRVSAREELAPPQFRTLPWAHEASTAAAQSAVGREASTAAAQTWRAVAGLLPKAPPYSQVPSGHKCNLRFLVSVKSRFLGSRFL